jgi:molybdopterin synthase sulfur carrier subunit
MSMNIRVKFHANLRDDVGAGSLYVPIEEGAAVRDLLDVLIADHPALARRLYDENGDLSPHVMVFRDSQDIQLMEGLDTPLVPGATVNLFAAISGG